MSDILSAAVSALKSDQTKLEQFSLNAANATTPGYRRGVVVSTPFQSVLDAQGVSTSASATAPVLHAPSLTRAIDFSSSAMTQTGRPFDVAVEGDAFLALTDGNKTYVTRHGALSVNTDGELVGKSGLRLIGAQGGIRLESMDGVSIDARGALVRGDEILGQLRLVKLADVHAIKSTDGVLFETALDNLSDVSGLDAVAVKAGFLETSNTNNLKEMMGVLENTRHFESLIRLVQGYDEVMGKAIQRLGEV